ncbi:hypothetical protein G4V62_01870 [Bacillaceae bacterium SIJ1]|uniref:hypothetical protein n=1 Tax=Litoribacterium kuwaitense TaxID=1398745 RepID=UPI0013EA263B|nr:hypothetical protein [Litoribacterium kuwaitense]NGP43770.1 hypothetical protein [Litoribacterium kuwaitense]
MHAPLAKCTYIQQEHLLSVEGKQIITSAHRLCLYRHEITSSIKTWRLQDVFDVSYWMVSEQLGFIYLHTIYGVTPFLIEEPPVSFIETFKNLPHL